MTLFILQNFLDTTPLRRVGPTRPTRTVPRNLSQQIERLAL